MALSPAERAFQDASIAAFQRRAPGCRVGAMPGLVLRVLLDDGRRLQVGLADAFHSFLERGGRHDDLAPAADAHAAHALAAAPAAAPEAPAAPGRESFEEAMARVLPLVESAAFFEAADEVAASAPRLLRLRLGPEELALGLVLPGASGSMRFLSQQDLDRWQRPLELVEHQARKNLDARVRGRLTLALRHGVVVVVEESPWFQGTLALLPSFHARLEELLGPRPLLALPARDCAVALASAAEERWRPILPGLAKRHASDSSPLSTTLFACERGALRPAGSLPAANG